MRWRARLCAQAILCATLRDNARTFASASLQFETVGAMFADYRIVLVRDVNGTNTAVLGSN